VATVTSLFDTITQATPSVSEVAQRIGAALRDVGSGWVEGEVRSINRVRSGNVYLTLGDENANLDIVDRITPTGEGELLLADDFTPAPPRQASAHHDDIPF
jgi:hypothetical protein